jgi:hypothetical protein
MTRRASRLTQAAILRIMVQNGLIQRRPLFAVECKSGEKAISPAVHYFAERTPIPHFYQAHLGEPHHSSGKVTVLPFVELCREPQLDEGDAAVVDQK